VIAAAAGALELYIFHHCPQGGVCGVNTAGYDPVCCCGAPCLPDRPYRPGHGWVECLKCGAVVGICGAEAAAAVLDQAAAALQP
jgi:hypothetical protein